MHFFGVEARVISVESLDILFYLMEGKKKNLSVDNTTKKQKMDNYGRYPGSAFPQQCGIGNTIGGHGPFGQYESGQTDKIDYIADACGGDFQPAITMDCPAPKPLECKTVCGAGGEQVVLEGFDGRHCEKPVWFADSQCSLPPKHCGGYFQCDDPRMPNPDLAGGLMIPTAPNGAGAENAPGAPGIEESFVGDEGDAGRFAGQPADCGTGCGVKNNLQMYACDKHLYAHKDPGYQPLLCQMPYSAPYAVGPGCNTPTGQFMPPLHEGFCPGFDWDLFQKLAIAVLIAVLTYKYLLKK